VRWSTAGRKGGRKVQERVGVMCFKTVEWGKGQNVARGQKGVWVPKGRGDSVTLQQMGGKKIGKETCRKKTQKDGRQENRSKIQC